jgi:pimeloyl-ACP methyl ester carboxylesterase
MLFWEDDLCERLAAGPRFVVRYDQRDTGRSATYPAGEPGYTGDDLVDDAVGVLDAVGVTRAHVVGISSGGGVAQLVALDHPDRVASLVLISTTAATAGAEQSLPGPSERLRAYFAHPPPRPDWSDRGAVVDYLVEDERVYAAPSRAFEDASRRALAGRVYDRALDIAASMTNHDVLAEGGRDRGRVDEIRMPTLVVHGTEDPLFPVEHGEALARAIPGARLLRVERMGHDLPREAWDVVVPEILRHTAP